MADNQPTQTTSLRPNEWQALCHGGAAQLAGLFASTGTLDDAAYQAASEHMARLSMFMRAWRATSVQPQHEQPTGLVAEHAGLTPGHVHPQGNGADPEPAVKKRRGRPPKVKPEARAVQ